MAVLKLPTPPRPPTKAPTTRDNHYQDTITLLRSAYDGDNETTTTDALIMLARSASRNTTGWYQDAQTPNRPPARCSLDDQLILMAHSHSTLEGQHFVEAQGPPESRYLDELILEPSGSSTTKGSAADFDSLGEMVSTSGYDDLSRNSLMDYLDDDDDSILLSMQSSMIDVEPPMRLSRS